MYIIYFYYTMLGREIKKAYSTYKYKDFTSDAHLLMRIKSNF